MVSGYMPLVLISAVAGFALLLGFWQMLVAKRLGRQLRQLQQQLDKIIAAGEQKPSFSTSLKQVEEEQKVVAAPTSSSEKYRYVASLAEQGVDAQGIAAALQLAPAEVAQLLQLARLKRQV
ncbi:MAG: hypothetical protein KAU22_11760 [Desulfuromonadales bacterium]|nr:hypothetical protein [Desulfuromonadales bacterium]